MSAANLGSNARRWPFYSEPTVEKVAKLVRDGVVYAPGQSEAVSRFEEKFSRKLVRNRKCLMCDSGTGALYSAYFSLGLSPGAEILVPSNTFKATVTPLFLLNLQPVFCDADWATGCIDFDDAERRITPRTEALVVTHIWGHPAQMNRALELASKHRLAVIEDCSHAHGARWEGQEVGTFGDVAIFSVGTKKMVSGGAGGVLVTSDQRVFERALLLGHPPDRIRPILRLPEHLKQASAGWGANFRSTPICATLAEDHLDRLDETIEIKNHHTDGLSDLLNRYLPALRPPQRDLRMSHGGWYAFKARWTGSEASASQVVSALNACGIEASQSSQPLHSLGFFTDPPRSSINTTWEFGHVDSGSFPIVTRLREVLVEIETLRFYEYSTLMEEYSTAIQKAAKIIDRYGVALC